jgi:hypothetical protein
VVRRSPSKLSYVTVVADNPQTLEDLYAYFKQVGVTSNGARELDSAAVVPADVTSLVLFPDDFGQADVEATILALRRARPKLLIVLVTGAPQRLAAALEPDGRSLLPLVLPKPAFGWTILDAIQGRAERSPS